jgi:agmatinase
MSLSAFDPTDEIALSLDYPLLRPPGSGLFSESSGASPYAERLHIARYGASEVSHVEQAWRESLATASTAERVLLGVPTETGSGSIRGTAYGPVGIREAMGADIPADLCDLGDVLCIPHLLHDDMLNESQILRVREAVFGEDCLVDFPVSPLSITECVVRGLLNRPAGAPTIITLGGDHSITGAVLPPFIEHFGQGLGVLHIDAHSDLADRRFGISLTYSSWVMHVERRTKIGALAQFGLASRSDVEEVSPRLLQVGAQSASSAAIDTVIGWLADKGTEQLYITIDIDATDRSAAPATGLPALDGLTTDTVLETLDRLSAAFPVVGADIVEVAPPLGEHDVWGQETTCLTAARYLKALTARRPIDAGHR